MEKSVLIFDDDEDILCICTHILTAQGWQVNGYPNVTDVVEKTTAAKPDVIIMDNWIPESGGIVATQSLKNANACKHIPIIFFSANSQVKALAAEAGADSYLIKPFDVAELVSAVNHALSLTM